MWDILKMSNTHVVNIPEKGGRGWGRRNSARHNGQEFLKPMNNINWEIKKLNEPPGRENENHSFEYHSQTSENQRWSKICKVPEEERHITFKDKQ